MKSVKGKIIVILGPTATGKTKLAVRLSAKFSGEIVSADSRQVYRGMDVGTGKDIQEYTIEIPNNKFPASPAGRQIPNKNQNSKFKIQKFKSINIPYHLIDVVSPRQEFNLAKYQKLALRAVNDILTRGKLPIIVGGTGLYLQALVDGYALPQGKPDKKLRKKLEKLSSDALFLKLKKVNKKWAEKLNESDRKNKRRLIRYIEIISQESTVASRKSNADNKYDYLVLGITRPKEELEKRIYKRLIERLEKEDMIGEVKRLHRAGVSWKRLEGFGLEYKYIALYLQNKLGYEHMVEQLYRAIKQFSKKQMTWFRRWERQGRKIIWIESEREAAETIKDFLK